jgi:phosphoribosylformylglycinamidine synthase PurS subunit
MTQQRYAVRVTVRLDANVNDPPGNAIRDGLRTLGHVDVDDVRVGKVIDLTLDAPDAETAETRARQLCEDLLANPVIETFDVLVAEVATA